MNPTVCETVGLSKKAVGFGYARVRRYHPLLPTGARDGEVLHCWLRGGLANPQRGAASFLSETFAQARGRRARAVGPRVGPGLPGRKVLGTCRHQRARLSGTAGTIPELQKVIAAFPEEAWTHRLLVECRYLPHGRPGSSHLLRSGCGRGTLSGLQQGQAETASDPKSHPH